VAVVVVVVVVKRRKRKRTVMVVVVVGIFGGVRAGWSGDLRCCRVLVLDLRI
jgi:hypothetical protein